MRFADLHCDLLSYLEFAPGRSPLDKIARCSIPQLREGKVAFQALAIFSRTMPKSEESGCAQARWFRRILEEHPQSLAPLESPEMLEGPDDGRTFVLAAIENASAFCPEDGRLAKGFERLDRIENEVGRLFYVSLTWNDENRFGGGNETHRGLKDDGRSLLEHLTGKGIAIDLSHTSHWLAADILETLDAKGLRPPLLASHSCFRSVRDMPRNLPDDIAREILRRGGVIGLNFLTPFLEPESGQGLVANVRHALSLGAAEQYCLGADFFADFDLPPEWHRAGELGYFLPEAADASCYPRLLEHWQETADWPENFLEGVAFDNAVRFLHRLWG